MHDVPRLYQTGAKSQTKIMRRFALADADFWACRFAHADADFCITQHSFLFFRIITHFCKIMWMRQTKDCMFAHTKDCMFAHMMGMRISGHVGSHLRGPPLADAKFRNVS